MDHVESLENSGRLSSVVSSADCRSGERTETPSESIPQINLTNDDKRDGAAGIVPVESAEHILTLEDRLLVAIAARGDVRMGQFIFKALARTGESVLAQLDLAPDEHLVATLEAEAFR
jgi:hypothetical protein